MDGQRLSHGRREDFIMAIRQASRAPYPDATNAIQGVHSHAAGRFSWRGAIAAGVRRARRRLASSHIVTTLGRQRGRLYGVAFSAGSSRWARCCAGVLPAVPAGVPLIPVSGMLIEPGGRL